MTVVAVTGANGFVGSALMAALPEYNCKPRGLVRSSSMPGSVTVADIGPDTEWGEALSGVDTVIHCAARVHVMKDDAADPLAEFRRVNTEGTRRLASQAAQSGVRRLVFVSSIKVNGESTGFTGASATPFTAEDEPAPKDPYAISKWEAECALHEIAAATDLEVVIVRPPLVYGPGVGGNFRSMINIVRRGIPLPLGLVRNRRSLVALRNLVDLLVQCASNPEAVGQTFLVSDGEDLSTPELIRRLALAMGKRARLFPVPPSTLRWVGRATGHSDKVDRLIGSLQVDISHTRERLGWEPSMPVDEGLRLTVESA